MWRWIALLLVLPAVLLAIACEEEEADDGAPTGVGAAQPTALPEHSLSIRAEVQDSAELVVTGTANLPDGSVLGVSLSRRVVTNDDPPDSDRYPGLGGAVPSVQNGQYEARFSVRDLHEAFEPFLQVAVEQGAFDFEVISIDDVVTVSVTLTPRADQPSHVYSTLGDNFERLNGPQVEDTDFGFRVLSVDTTVELPYER